MGRWPDPIWLHLCSYVYGRLFWHWQFVTAAQPFHPGFLPRGHRLLPMKTGRIVWVGYVWWEEYGWIQEDCVLVLISFVSPPPQIFFLLNAHVCCLFPILVYLHDLLPQSNLDDILRQENLSEVSPCLSNFKQAGENSPIWAFVLAELAPWGMALISTGLWVFLRFSSGRETGCISKKQMEHRLVKSTKSFLLCLTTLNMAGWAFSICLYPVWLGYQRQVERNAEISQ